MDASDNVILTGWFNATIDFGGGTLVTAKASDTFLAKLDEDGGHVWSQRFGGLNNEHGLGVAVDPLNNIVITGWYARESNFGGGTLTNHSLTYDMVIAKYDPTGAHLWSKGFGGIAGDQGLGLGVDAWGNVFVTGFFQGTANFGGDTFVSVGIQDAFLAKYDSNGVHQWSREFGGQGGTLGSAVAVDASGGVVFTGRFQDFVDFGGGDLSSAGHHDVFLAKYQDQHPVPVLIKGFRAEQRGTVVDVFWDFWGDETVDHATLYRCEGASAFRAIMSSCANHVRSHTDTTVEPGRIYNYQLAVRTVEGEVFRSPALAVTVDPLRTELGQNFPNPFNPSTLIGYELASPGPVSLRIYDVTGSLVKVLEDRDRPAGRFEIGWDGDDERGERVASGVYFYRLTVPDFTQTRKLVLLK